MHKCQVILIDDHPIVLSGLCELIGQIEGYEVVGTGQNAQDAVTLTARVAPDLVIMDLNMGGNVLGAIQQIASARNAPPIIVFTASNQISDCNAAMSHGAQGYVVKGSSGNEIFQALGVVMCGQEYVSNELAARMLREMRRPTRSHDDKIQLTFREEQIVRELMTGASNKVIAQQLHLSEKTVKYYMTQIIQKFEVQNRLQVVVAARGRLV